MFTFLLLFFIFSSPVWGQIKTEQEDNSIFSEVAAEHRARLIERLNLFIELEKTGKFNESYKMIAEEFKKRIQDGWNENQYSEATNIKIKKFIPNEISASNDKTLISISGCGKAKASTEKSLYLIEAYLKNNDWYFSAM